jgi:hypothetical protein
LVSSSSEAIELSRRLVGRRLIEDGTQVAAERLMLTGAVGSPEAVRANSASPMS